MLNGRTPAASSAAHPSSFSNNAPPVTSPVMNSTTQLDRPTSNSSNTIVATIDGGTHTIDANYIVTNFGYTNGILPMGITITKTSFVLLQAGVSIVAESSSGNSNNNAITLKDGSYLLGNGGRLVGGTGSSDLSTAAMSASAVSRQSQLRKQRNSTQANEAQAEAAGPGHGLMVINSRADTMDGFHTEGGSSTHLLSQTSGAALYVTEKSTVTIRGGRFTGGLHSFDSTTLLNQGPSLLVDGTESIVHVHKGTFDGVWKVISGGSVVVHACSFSMDSLDEQAMIRATLVDGSELDIPYINDGSGKITSLLVHEGCAEESIMDTKGEDTLVQNAIIHLTDTPTRLPTPISSIQPQPTAEGSTVLPTVATSRISLDRPPVTEDTGGSTTIAPGSKPTESLSLQLDIEDFIFSEDKVVSSADTVNVAMKGEKNGGVKGCCNVGTIVVAAEIGVALLLFNVF
mmetsp:Transcript_45/g.70  ORF Transcript_45/g.70 Transcript_45/m.70 type:complete len:458 (+) Transcript_45:15-1388(+)